MGRTLLGRSQFTETPGCTCRLAGIVSRHACSADIGPYVVDETRRADADRAREG